MGEWWHNRWDWWVAYKFKHPWWACLLQYGGLALVVGLVFHVSSILSGMTDVDYFRYPLNETFRHPFNATANLTINKSAEMNTPEIYAAEMYADNARSILCTLVGSEAAIVAIVVSLTLIAIELTASAYSPRVINVSLRNPDMWFLLFIYGVSIFYAVVLIKQLPYDSWIPYDDVSFAFWLGVFSYVALVPYLLNIIRLLNPTTIVRQVSKKIAEDKILKYIKDQEGHSKPSTEDRANETSKTNGDTEGYKNVNLNQKKSKEKKTNENPIQPILDIIYRSINNYDLETVRNGLEEIVKHAKKVSDSYFFSWANVLGKDKEKLLIFLMYYFDIGWAENAKVRKPKFNDGDIISISTAKDSAKIKINERGKEAILKFPDGKTRDLKVKTENKKRIIYINLKDKEQWISEYFCDPLKRIARLAASKDDAGSTIEVIKNLQTFGEYTANAELNAATGQVAVTLGAVGKISAGKGNAFEDAVNEVASSLKAVREPAAEKKLDAAVKEVVKSLATVGEAAAEHGFKNECKGVITDLKDFGTVIWEKEKILDDVAKEVATSLGTVGKAAAEHGFDDVANEARTSLSTVGKAAAEHGFDDVAKEAAKSLGTVGKAAAEHGFDDVTKEAATSLSIVGETAAEHGLKNATKQAAMSLSIVGEAAAEHGLKNATKQAALTIGGVGVAAAEQGFEDATKEAATSLTFFGKSVAKKKLEEVTVEVISSLKDIGKTAVGKGQDVSVLLLDYLKDVGETASTEKLKDAVKEAVTSLFDLGITAVENKRDDKAQLSGGYLAALTISSSSEEIVKNAIQRYEGNFNSLLSLIIFNKLYEDELKKQRARASK